jgi:hypothetical protein
VGILNISRPKVKPGSQATSEIELTISTMTCTAQMPAFDNLSDNFSQDVHGTHPLEKMIEKCASPPHVVSGEFLCYSFTLFTTGSDDCLFRSGPACALVRFATRESRRRPGVLPSSCKFCFASVFLRYHACFGRLFYFVGAALSKKQWEKRAAESAQVAKIAVLEVVAISQVDKIAKLEATYID